MTSLFDSHCHFLSGCDVAGQLERARAAGLAGLLVAGGDPEADAGALEAVRLAPGFALAALGVAPDAPEDMDEGGRTAGPDYGTAPGRAAVGEIGLEYSHGEPAPVRAMQRRRFARQVQEAARLGLPCSVHCREADDDLIAILRENTSPELAASARAGSLHCFVGQRKLLEALVPLGWSFGLSGILTFPNAKALRETVLEIPRDRLLVETDSPFLAPAPHRGETCEPAYVMHTARLLAELLGISFEECGRLVTANAMRVFGGAAAK